MNAIKNHFITYYNCYFSRYELTTSGDLFGTLTIQNTTFSDSGQYRCTVTNIHGNDSLLVYLSVQGKI